MDSTARNSAAGTRCRFAYMFRHKLAYRLLIAFLAENHPLITNLSTAVIF